MPFPFENLTVYQEAIRWADTADELCKELKGRISNSLKDQLCRAALSVSLNIAEGNGRWHKGDRRQFFWVARGSAFECVPIIQILRRR